MNVGLHNHGISLFILHLLSIIIAFYFPTPLIVKLLLQQGNLTMYINYSLSFFTWTSYLQLLCCLDFIELNGLKVKNINICLMLKL